MELFSAQQSGKCEAIIRYSCISLHNPTKSVANLASGNLWVMDADKGMGF